MKGTLGRIGFAALAAIGLAATAVADAAEPPVVTVNIPAQQVGDALSEFAKQSGLQVVFYTEIAEGLQAHALSGTYRLNEALARLLAGTTLRFELLNDRTIAVKGPAVGESTSTRAPEATSQMLLAQSEQGGRVDTPGVTGSDSLGERAQVTSDSAAAEPGTLSGRVTEAASGRTLPGAIVRIEGTPYATQTDDLGRFRFASIHPGSYRVSISYLGYEPVESQIVVGQGEIVTAEFQFVRAAQDLNEIVVFGTRSARALALNQQRTAENSSSVVSADMLGNFTGTTIAETLRHVQGITFTRDPITGDGTNIMIRGLAPGMNAVTLNGVNLPATYLKNRNFDRSPDISYLLADSISKITVNYTLLPNQSSTGTGGLVEIETKSPLDRPARYFNFSVEGARKGDGFGDDFLASGTVSRTFGDAQSFGLSASVQYRERSDRNFQYDAQLNYGPFLPLSDAGIPIDDLNFVDPRTRFPFEPGSARAFPNAVSNNLHDVSIANVTTTLSAAWQPGDNASFRLDYTRATDERDSFARSANMQVAMPLTLLPVASLDGEQRWMYAWDQNVGGMGVVHNYGYENGARDVTDTVAFNGRNEWRRLELEYRLGYARGSTDSPDSWNVNAVRYEPNFTAVDPTFIDPVAIDSIEGRVLSPFGERRGRAYPVALLTPAGYDYFNDAGRFLVNPGLFGITWSSAAGYDTKRTAELSARYNLERGVVRYLETGLSFESSRYKTTRQDSTFYSPTCEPECLFADDLGLTFTQPGLTAVGITQPGFNFLTREGVEGLIARMPALSDGSSPVFERYPSLMDPRVRRQFTDEDNLAAYVQARVDVGRLEIIGGARVARAEASNETLSFPMVILESGFQDEQFTNEFSRLVTMSGTATDVLPRIGINFRQTDNLVLRGSYYLTVARPSLQDLSADQTLFLDFSYVDPATGNQRPFLQIFQGTPGLKPTKTDNYDVSVEYYHDQLGLMRLSAFYKLSKNLLETNEWRSYAGIGDDTPLPDHEYFRDLPDDLIVSRTQPGNSPDPGSIWGVEAGIERQFAFLPGIWSGFGVYANATYTDSSMVQTMFWSIPPVFDADGNLMTPGRDRRLRIDDEPYEQQSPFSGTAALTYNEYGIDASLSYTYQARSRSFFEPYYLRRYSESFDTLDLRVARRFSMGPGSYTMFFEAVNLLKDARDPDLETTVGGGQTPKFHTNGGFIGGRAFRLGMSGSF